MPKIILKKERTQRKQTKFFIAGKYNIANYNNTAIYKIIWISTMGHKYLYRGTNIYKQIWMSLIQYI